MDVFETFSRRKTKKEAAATVGMRRYHIKMDALYKNGKIFHKDIVTDVRAPFD